MRIDASAVLAATTAGGANPEACRKDTAWWATTSRIDRPLAASTHANRAESCIGSKDSGELCCADIGGGGFHPSADCTTGDDAHTP
jgi:hypothetical protein